MSKPTVEVGLPGSRVINYPLDAVDELGRRKASDAVQNLINSRKDLETAWDGAPDANQREAERMLINLNNQLAKHLSQGRLTQEDSDKLAKEGIQRGINILNDRSRRYSVFGGKTRKHKNKKRARKHKHKTQKRK
jgi:hypothetical protein